MKSVADGGYYSDEEEKPDYAKEAEIPERGKMYGVYPGPRAPPAVGARDASAFSTHNRMLDNFMRYGGKRKLEKMKEERAKRVKTDYDVLRENYKLERSSEDESEEAEATYEQKVSRKYYNKLYREYGIINLSRYKTGQYGIRWRHRQEVSSGKGEAICGGDKCNETESLQSFEVPFQYKEQGERKKTLIKIRLCPDCTRKMNYKKIKETNREIKKLQKKERKILKKLKKKEKKKKRKPSIDDNNADDAEDFIRDALS